MAEGKNVGDDVSLDIDSLRTEAHRLLQEFRVAAGEKAATDVEKRDAETAREIVDTAEEGSQLVQVALADSRLISCIQWMDLYASLEEEFKSVLSAADMERTMMTIENVMTKVWKEVPTTHKEFTDSVTWFDWRGWNEACERLMEHRAGLAFNPKQTGEA